LDLVDNSLLKEYDIFVMNTVKAYEEVIDFIAAGTTPQNVIAFRPSEAAQERVTDLLSREKEGELSREEKSELDHYLQIEHLMRLAKARARDFLPNE
jgi:adenosine/AMP kinase